MGFAFFDGEAPSAGHCTDPIHTDLQLLPRLLHSAFGPPHCHLCPTAMAKALGGFDTNLKCGDGCADWEFWLRTAFAGADGAYTPFVGAYYRRHASSMSTDRADAPLGHRSSLARSRRSKTSPEFQARWGQALLDSELRFLRRWLATDSSRHSRPLVDGSYPRTAAHRHHD